MSGARWMIFCESAGDQRTAEVLVDALLRLWGDDWVASNLDAMPESVRVWWHHESGSCWYDIHRVDAIAADLEVRLHQGHFGGEPAEPGAVMFDTCCRIARKLCVGRAADKRPTALVVLWDTDDQPAQRRAGVKQAEAHAAAVPTGMAHIVALAEPEREAWVLAGFDPADGDERAKLEAWRRSLGYAPHEQAHRLSAGRATAKGDSKKVLDDLCPTPERERACLAIPDHARRDLLVTRGEHSGLKHWIEAVEKHLLPQVDPSVRGRIPVS